MPAPLLVLAGLALGALSCTQGFASVPTRPPNFVIILADDMGYADLSCYGNDRYATPHLDALAKSGLRFTDFHANGPVCSPTRAALLTGRYQQRSGITEVVFADPKLGKRDDHGLRSTEVTFAKLLQGSGYRTGLMGKWHLGYASKFNPVHHGFDEFRGYLSGNVDFHSHLDQAGFADWWHNLELRDEPGYTTHLITRHAVRFLEANAARPFCLYVAHEAPHAPYQGPRDPPVRGPQAGAAARGPEVQRAYREMVQEMDRGVGEIVATLQRLGLTEHTLVFFFSDNGGTREANNGPLHGTKGTLWEGGHRVPALAAWPGRIQPGRVTAQTALGMDLLPTLLELSGTAAPAGHRLDGTSLSRLLLADEPLPARTLFWGYNDRSAVRRGPWKLVVNAPAAASAKAKKKATTADPALGLYHLGDDVGERNNLAESQPAIVRDLQSALAAWQREVGAAPILSR
jgi:arylsulfatase A-like enzyme